MEKKKSTTKKTSGFQDSFKRLEEILEKLENEVEDSSLEEIINYYIELNYIYNVLIISIISIKIILHFIVIVFKNQIIFALPNVT